MENILITQRGGHLRAYPLTTIRVTSHLGAGTVRYLTEDGWAGVHVDGSLTVDGRPRVDEIHVEQLSLAA